MAQIFISYSRVDAAFAERFVTRLKRKFPNHEVWIDTEITGGDDWWVEILKAINSADIFVYLLSNESVASAYCQAEFQEAQRLQKRIITVQVRDRTKITGDLSKIQYVDMKNGADDVDAQDELTRAIVRQVGLIPTRRPRALWTPITAKPDIPSESPRLNNAPDIDTPELNIIPVQSPTQTQSLSTPKPGSWWPLISAVLLGTSMVLSLAIVIQLVIQFADAIANTPTPEPTRAAFVDSDTPTATLRGTEILATLSAEQTVVALVQAQLGETATAQMFFDAQASATQVVLDAAETEAYGTIFALTASSTPTITPTPNATQTLEAFAAAGVTRNADWTPVEREFDGVVMVLVPAGCFMMGSTTGDSDEQPVHEVCIEEAFWLDKTEVTQAQLRENNGVQARASNFTGDNRPVERITWFEGEAYCREWRGGRLPTEAEWEFAARGPDGLVYPWGNEFVVENVVANRGSSQGTETVGSRPGGESWVGALDLSGNVWEWTASLYELYPYAATDGREDLTADGNRVLRGGSWVSFDASLRTAYRSNYSSRFVSNIIGFRCARSFVTE